MKLQVIAAVFATFFLSSARQAWADIITFNDLTDDVTVTYKDTNRIIQSSIREENRIVKIFTPVAGAQTGTGPTNIYIAEDDAKTIVSDYLVVEVHREDPNNPFYNVYFYSDIEGEPAQMCPVAGCDMVETGGLQTAITLDWVDNDGKVVGTDTIKFQSDVDVPEPCSTFLLLTALAGTALIRLRPNGSQTPVSAAGNN